VDELSSWMDGYLQAHAVLEALADRTLLATLPDSSSVLARFTDAFALADAAPRSADRSHGLRTLRRGLPDQVALAAGRWPETLEWMAERTAARHPETREMLSRAIAALRGSFPGAQA